MTPHEHSHDPWQNRINLHSLYNKTMKSSSFLKETLC